MVYSKSIRCGRQLRWNWIACGVKSRVSTSRADAVSGLRHAEVSAALGRRLEQLQAIDRRLTDTRALLEDVATARSTHFPAFARRLRDGHPAVQLTDAQWERFQPTFAGEVDVTLEEAISTADAQLKEIQA